MIEDKKKVYARPGFVLSIFRSTIIADIAARPRDMEESRQKKILPDWAMNLKFFHKCPFYLAHCVPDRIVQNVLIESVEERTPFPNCGINKSCYDKKGFPMHTGSNFIVIVVARAISNFGKNHTVLICRF